MNTTKDTLYKADQVAAILGQTAITVYSYIKRGKLKSIKTGKRRLLIRHADLLEFLQAETAPISAKPQLRK